ncbi:MAG: ROK family protein [Clostridiales bacterium]|nr:ROK family protein [Clostridiales bacterium]
MKKVLGINIGGTTCSVSLGLGDENSLEILDKRSFPTYEYPLPEAALEKFAAESERIVGGRAISAVGISCGGPLDIESGVILSPPNLPGWDRVAVCGFFEEACNVPVFLQNDANAGAVAEWMYGAGRGAKNFIFLTFGTGLGAGLILNGRLYSGLQGMAGEIGHWRVSSFGPVGYGKAGSLEGFCSGGGIVQLAQEKLLKDSQLGFAHPLTGKEEGLTAKDVFESAREGDGLCLEVVKVVGETFGAGLAMLIDLLNPEAIVAGSIFSRGYDLLFPIVQRVVDEEALKTPAQNCRILPSALGEEIGEMSALATAMYSNRP